MGIGGVAVALGGGEVGKKAGKAFGTKPWHKLFAPAGAGALATIYHGVTGDSETAVDIAVGGAKIGIIATGTFSLFKNITELFK